MAVKERSQKEKNESIAFLEEAWESLTKKAEDGVRELHKHSRYEEKLLPAELREEFRRLRDYQFSETPRVVWKNSLARSFSSIISSLRYFTSDDYTKYSRPYVLHSPVALPENHAVRRFCELWALVWLYRWNNLKRPDYYQEFKGFMTKEILKVELPRVEMPDFPGLNYYDPLHQTLADKQKRKEEPQLIKDISDVPF
jgi:hypothetical protein